MPKLPDLQASLLLEEIACAMRIGAPMDESLRRLQSRRLGAVGSVAGRIADGVEQGLSVAEAIRAVDPESEAAAAVEVCQRRGDPSLLEQIAFQLRRRASVRAESRLAWFYPWVLLAVGYLVAVFVLAPMVRRFNGDGVRWPNEIVAAAEWLENNWWIPVIIVVAVLGVLSWLFRRSTRQSRPIRLSLFCSALAEQIQHDVPEAEALRLAAGLAGDASLMSSGEATLLSPIVVDRIDGSGDWQRMVKQGDKLSMVAALRYRARSYEEQARRRDFLWMRVVPRALMVLVGAGLVLAYVWWVIAPVYRQVATW